MKNKYWSPLSKEDLAKIHSASLDILEKTGMAIDHSGAREMLQEAGCCVDHEKKLVRFSPDSVERCLQSVPQAQVFAGRNTDMDMSLKPGGEVYLRTTSGPTNYIDLKTGEYKEALIDDMKEFARLGDALLHINGNGTLHAGDVPRKTADIHSLHALLVNTEKHLYAQSFSVKNLKFMIEMLLAVCGIRENIKKRPLMHIVIGIMSPLFIPEDDVDMLFLAGEYGIPVGMCVVPNSGATSPLTLAGTLAQGNAELLAGITLAQLKNPGHQTPYYCIPMVTDMSTGMVVSVCPETVLMNAVLCQLGREFYRLPVMASGIFCDTVISEQIMFQKAQNALAVFLSGANLLLGAGSVEAGLAYSPVQLVIDDEIMAMTQRFWQGFEITKETLGLDSIDRIGPQGNFLADDHTLKYLRTGEHLRPELFSRDSRESWISSGSKNTEARAREKAIALLEEHQVEPLPEDVSKELSTIVSKADQELA